MRIPIITTEKPLRGSSEISGLSKWLTQLQNQLAELKPDNDEVQIQLKSLQIGLQQSLDTQAKQQAQQIQCQKQIALLRHQIDLVTLAKDIQPLDEKVKSLEAELSQLKLLLPGTSDTASDIATRLKTLHDEYLNLKKGSEQVAKFNSGMRAQLQVIIEQSGRQADLFSAWQREFTDKLQEQTTQQQGEFNELQSQLSQTKLALSKRLAALEGRVSQVESKIISLDEKVTVSQPEYTLIAKLQMLRKLVLKDEHITQELAYYIAPNGQPDPTSTDHSPLYQWMEKEFLHSDARVMLLQGQAGAGKSTFHRHVLRQLWQDKDWESFNPGDSIPELYIPIFVPLGSTQVEPKKIFDYFRDLPELVDDFTDAEINVLKRDYHLLLIADGYDEMPGQRAINLYDANQLHQYEGRVKLLIGCRTQRSQEISEKEFFVPHDRSGNAQFSLYKSRHVSPFDEKQITSYIEKYLAKNKDQSDLNLWSDAATYQQYFEKLSDLKKLIDTPFLLLITVQVLPKIVAEVEREAKSTSEAKDSSALSLSSISLTRSKLYDRFMEQWFTRQLNKEREAGILPESGELQKDYQQFCKKLAACFHKANIAAIQFPFEQEELFAESSIKEENSDGPKGSWVKMLFGNDNQRIVQARRGSPLRMASGNYHQFIHASLIDYFLTTAVWQHSVDREIKAVVKKEEAKATDPISAESKESVKDDEVIKPKDSVDSAQKIDSPISDPNFQVLTVNGEEVLAQGLLSFDQRNFLADRVQQDDIFKQYLFSLIERSKEEEDIAAIAANAITILNTARVSFSGMDFNGIRIPGADLSYAVMDSTQLKNADLSGVTLVGAWLNQADFTGSNMENIEWGECPSFKLPAGMIIGTVYSNDGCWVARSFDSLDRVQLGERPEIYLYDTETYQLQRAIKQYTYHTYRTHVKNYYLVLTQDLIAEGELPILTIWKLGLERNTAAYIRVRSQLYFSTTSYGSECKLIDVTEKQLIDFDEAMKANSLSLNKPRELSDQELWKIKDITGHLPWELCSDNVYYPENIAFDDQSKYLVSKLSSKIAFWDVSTGESLFSIQLPDILRSNIAIDTNGEYLACCTGWVTGPTFKLNLYLIPSGEKQSTFDGITSEVKSLAFDPKGLYLATAVGHYDRNIEVNLWDITTGKLFYTLTTEEKGGNECSIVFSPQGEYLSYTASGKRNVWHSPVSAYVWHLETKKIHWFGKTTCEIVFDPQEEYFATSDDLRVKLWHAASAKLEKTFEGHKDAITNIFFDPNCEYLISESLDKTIRKWRLSAFSSTSNLKNITCLITGLTVSPNGEYLASSSDKAVCLWQTTTGKLECKLEGHEDNIEDFVIHPSSKVLLAAAGKLIYLWDLTARKLEATMLYDQAQDLPDIKKIKSDWRFEKVRKLAIHPGGALMASLIKFSGKRVDYQGITEDTYMEKCMIWNLKEKKIERVLNENRDYYRTTDHFVFHSSGKYLEYGRSRWFFNERPKYDWQHDEVTSFWSTIKYSYLYHYVECFEFTSKSEWMALAGGSYTPSIPQEPPVTLWNESTKMERRLEGHTKTINTVAFDPSGGLLGSGSDDLTARIWQVATGTCLAIIEGFMGSVKKIAWSQNSQGLFFAAFSDEKALRVWRIDANADKSALKVMLCWTTYQAVLTALNTCMKPVRGLQDMAALLLQQRGARVDIFQHKSQDSKDKDDVKEGTKESLITL